MDFIEIRSSLNSNASISSSSIVVDTSDYLAAGKEKFEESIIIDVIKSEIQEHNLELPTRFETVDTSDYILQLNLFGAESFSHLINGINIFHSRKNYIRRGECGHPCTGWLSRDDNVAFFCDNVFLDKTDLRYLMYSFDKAEEFIASTKDKCLGFSLANLGAISTTYKKLWSEITPNFLEKVRF